MMEIDVASTHQETSGSTMQDAARFAQLGERVTNISQRQTALETEMRSGFTAVERSIDALSTDIRGSSKTQWPVIWAAIGVSFAVITAIGTLAYTPVLSNQGRLENIVSRFGDTIATELNKKVDTEQYDQFIEAYNNNRNLTRGDYDKRFGRIEELLDKQVPRAEHERVWTSWENQITGLQRQVDEVKQAIGSIYNARDAMIDLRNRLDKIEASRESYVGPR